MPGPIRPKRTSAPIDRDTALDLLQRLARFLETEQGDVKRLQDIDPPEFRLRVGDYRVRYRDHGDVIDITRAPP